MRALSLWQVEMIPWYAFALYWAFTALRVKRTKAAESLAKRLGTLATIVLAFVLLFKDWLRVGPLGRRFVPEDVRLVWAGIVLTAVGCAVAIWARYFLGENWSARVTLKEGHQLIRSGPYRYVRHPIYTGMLLAVLGTALVIGEWRGVLAAALVWMIHSFKARREEALLAREFGEEYSDYRRTTGSLFPRLWTPRS